MTCVRRRRLPEYSIQPLALLRSETSTFTADKSDNEAVHNTARTGHVDQTKHCGVLGSRSLSDRCTQGQQRLECHSEASIHAEGGGGGQDELYSAGEA